MGHGSIVYYVLYQVYSLTNILHVAIRALNRAEGFWFKNKEDMEKLGELRVAKNYENFIPYSLPETVR